MLSQLFLSAFTYHFILIFLFLGLVLRFLVRHMRQLIANRQYRDFAKGHGCGQINPLPRRFLGSFRHKLGLLLAGNGADLLDEVFAAKYRKYGDTHALHDNFGRPTVIHTIDPANLNAMLSSSWTDWRPSKSRTNTLKPLAQGGLLLADGEAWHQKRKLVQRHLSQRKIKDCSRNEEHISNLIGAIGPVNRCGWTEPVDLLDLFHRFALDTSTALLLGASANSQLEGMRARHNKSAKPSAMTYNQAYEVIKRYYARRAKLGSLYWLADGPEYRQACAVMNTYVDQLVTAAIARSMMPQEDGESVRQPALIDSLVVEIGNPQEIRNTILDLFIAGQSMTGTVAAWHFAQLESHPDVFRELRNEIISKFGTESKPRATITWNNMRACSLLQRAIMETLRLYPLLATIGRVARYDTVLPRGGGPDGCQPIAVPKGAAVTCNVYSMHRRREDWGEDAHEFRPDLWIGRKLGPEYAPFGVGPRICVGQQLSMAELSLLTVKMLQSFDALEAVEGHDILEKGYRVVLSPKNGKLQYRLSLLLDD